MKFLKGRFAQFKPLSPLVVGSIAVLSLAATPFLLKESEAEFTSSGTATITVKAQEWIVSSATSTEPKYRSVEVSWTKLPEYSTYTLQTSVHPDFSTFTTVEVTGVTQVVNNLDPATTYHFRVRPVDGPTGAWFNTSVTTSAWRVLSFGFNDSGQLGDSTKTTSGLPVGSAVTAGLSATDVSAGTTHSCAVMDDAAWCWGDNSSGQLGNGTQTSDPTPQRVPLNSPVTAIAAGGTHSCALSNGDVWCWGGNDRGQVGGGPLFEPELNPVKVAGIPAGKVTAIKASYSHTCAIAERDLWCWGNNTYYQIGSNAPETVYSPMRVNGLPRGEITSVSTGYSNTCAIALGNAWCWGGVDENDPDSMSFDASTYPIRVNGLPAGAITLLETEGYGESSLRCASDGSSLWCWGNNSFGQLANGNTTSMFTPTKAASLPAGHITSISNGADSVCVIKDGTPWCWGDNCEGQLGDGTITERIFPAKVHNIPEGSASKVVESVWDFGSIHTMVLRK